MAAHYHVWHSKRLAKAAPFATVTLSIPRADGKGGTEKKTFQSLRNDMAELRRMGAELGIVDPSCTELGKRSAENRQLWALKVGRNSQHKVLFTGCHHAREWISVEMPYLVAKYLIEGYQEKPGDDPEKKRIKHLVDNREIWFVPLVNPDGHMCTVVKNRKWRPNHRLHVFQNQDPFIAYDIHGKSRTIHLKRRGYRGIDINRNYPTATWGLETPTATSRDPADCDRGTWVGPSANSEPETQAMVDLIRQEKFRANLTYHSFGQLVLFALGAQDDAFTQDVGQGMHSLIQATGAEYTYMSDAAQYPTTGDLLEFSWAERPGRPAFCTELRPYDVAPEMLWFSRLPESQIEPTFKENLNSALALINAAGFDAPAGSVTIPWTPKTRVGQVVRNCWRALEENSK
jgi:carboxypeptidase T